MLVCPSSFETSSLSIPAQATRWRLRRSSSRRRWTGQPLKALQRIVALGASTDERKRRMSVTTQG